MSETLLGIDRRVLAVGVAVVASLVAVALLLPTLDVTDTPFSAYGDADDDTSVLVNGMRAQGYEVSSLTLGPAGLSGVAPDRTDAFYLAVGVDRGYTQPGLDQVMSFAREGGTVIVMDDTGASDGLLDRIGVDKGPLLLSTTGDQPSVVPTQIRGSLVNLWEPVELVPRQGANVDVLATTDNTTAKDIDGDGQIAAEEPTCTGGCALAIRAEVGQGAVYVVSDATFATNKYATSAGAVGMLTGLAQEETTGRRAMLIVDESRHVAGPAEVGLTVFRTLMIPLGIDWVPYTGAGLVLVGAAISWLRRGEQAWPDHDPGLDAPYTRGQEREISPDEDPTQGGPPS